ncbi:MAG: WD40 repeat domain-containing protein, partial [Myxococcota bacterium]
DEGHFSLLDRPARAMAFSPDSSALVIGNHKGQLVQLAMPYGVVEQTWPLAAPGEPDVLSRELSFSPDGRFIAVTGRSPEGHAVPARVLDRHQGTVQTLTSHTAIHTALFNPQGTRIVGCGGDHIVVWSFPEMEVLRDVECPNAWLLDIHPDGERLAVVTGDGNDWDNVLHLIDATTGETLNSTEVMATSIAFHPDGQTLVYGSSRHGHLYRLSADLEGEETFIGTHSDNTPDALFFDTSGEHLASSSYQEGMIRFFEPNERLFWRYTQSGFASPSGRFAASPNQEWLLLGSVEGGGYGGPEVWSLEDLKPLGMLQHDMLCPQPMFNPHGDLVGCISKEDQTVRLYKVPRGGFWGLGHEGEGLTPWFDTSSQAQTMAFAASHRLMALGTTNSVEIWSVAPDAPAPALERQFDQPGITALVFADKAPTLATGDRDGEVALWDALTGKRVQPLPYKGPSGITAVVFHPSASWVFIASGHTAQRWPVDGSEPVVMEHDAQVNALELDSAGRRLVTGCQDGSIHLWDPLSGAYLDHLALTVRPMGLKMLST